MVFFSCSFILFPSLQILERLFCWPLSRFYVADCAPGAPFRIRKPPHLGVGPSAPFFCLSLSNRTILSALKISLLTLQTWGNSQERDQTDTRRPSRRLELPTFGSPTRSQLRRPGTNSFSNRHSSENPNDLWVAHLKK